MPLTPFTDECPTLPCIQPIRKSKHGTYYDMPMIECKHTFHRNLPPATVWGYHGMYLGPTIEVERGEPVYVKWANHLPKKHFLPVDFTVHGAHKDVPEVRTVTHLHGARVKPHSDGYPDAWFTSGFMEVGPLFERKVYHYENDMPACTLWYHDHAIGITRLNVYAGLAGFYLIHDQLEHKLPLPSGPFDIPLVIQDKSFNTDGSLYYPHQREKPVPELTTSIVGEFFGDTNVVNGKVWPYMQVEPRKYRFRLLNAANSRFYTLSLDLGQPFYLIATDGALTPAPVCLQKITLSPAERVEVIIDFTGMEQAHIILKNEAPAPYPGGPTPDPNTTGIVMAFHVTQPLSAPDTSMIPQKLRPIKPLNPTTAAKERYLTLDHLTDEYGRPIMLLNKSHWDDAITETPQLGTTEIWSFINLTDNSHAMHVHLIDFLILDRRPFDITAYEKDGTLHYTGPPRPPEREECGWKDTVRTDPGEVTRVIMHFIPYIGLYVWHCHMLEHEDYEMMRPFVVIK
ncbi:multicopper oxidase family protein [Shouchella lonarensis]|uniref:Spore coat protein A n=1 Tax=Shouchella lonarensis TaxID=1464122 RepID=A0A1G6MIY4_9BACI|nr:multicopper oxidase [Shouchella lonarensis]SDC55483.1 spore coat protein A [Shouchella lonarensis]